MVRNRNEDSDDSIVKTEASQGNREQSRGRTNSRGKFRGRQQNMAKNEEQGGKDMQGTRGRARTGITRNMPGGTAVRIKTGKKRQSMISGAI